MKMLLLIFKGGVKKNNERIPWKSKKLTLCCRLAQKSWVNAFHFEEEGQYVLLDLYGDSNGPYKKQIRYWLI